MSHSPRMGVKEANEAWDAQWSPFGRGKSGAVSPANGINGARAPSKFQWTYEEDGHERDKGERDAEDDSTSEEDEDADAERKEPQRPQQLQVGNKVSPRAASGFDSFDPFAPSAAPSPRSSMLTQASKYATPAVSPRAFFSTLTPKTRRPSLTVSPITVFPAPSSSIHPVPTVTSPPPQPGSPPLPSSVDAADQVATTHAPPKMATAAEAAVATTGASPEALAAAALLKRNTQFNKTIAATSDELFADLETPREPRQRRQGEKTVGFADDKGVVLAEVHVVPDDMTQYPIPDKKKKKGKGKGKEKCRVM